MGSDKTLQMHFRKDLSMLCILSLLEKSGEMYGYELVKAMGERSAGMFDLPEGTIYPVLYRLEEQGYVKQRAVRVGKRMNRYYYSLTDMGHVFYAELRKEYETVQRGVALILQDEEGSSNESNRT